MTQVEYDPSIVGYRQLLDVFWSNHDSRQVFGQGPDVGNQYRYNLLRCLNLFLFIIIPKLKKDLFRTDLVFSLIRRKS